MDTATQTIQNETERKRFKRKLTEYQGAVGQLPMVEYMLTGISESRKGKRQKVFQEIMGKNCTNLL